MTTTVLSTKIGEVENKIPEVSCLVKQANYNNEISDIEAKYFTTSNDRKFRSEILETKIKETRLVDKPSISNLLKKLYLNKKFTTLATRSKIKSRAR